MPSVGKRAKACASQLVATCWTRKREIISTHQQQILEVSLWPPVNGNGSLGFLSAWLGFTSDRSLGSSVGSLVCRIGVRPGDFSLRDFTVASKEDSHG